MRWSMLKAGAEVEVRSKEEILATLNADGCLDGLPFQPEMLAHCGKRYRVHKSAHKLCDTIGAPLNRRMDRAVLLEGVRCDGGSHDGCQAGCTLVWKHAWLRTIEDARRGQGSVRHVGERGEVSCIAGYSESALRAATTLRGRESGSPDVVYRCQATEMQRATRPMNWWDPRHYVEDLVTGNISLLQWARFTALAAFNWLMRLRWHWRQHPRVQGTLDGRTPSARLDLKAGEWVRVRSATEIEATLSRDCKNRGLFFDVEMLPHCGREYQVLRRVEKIIDERSGRMVNLPGGCLVLSGVVCSGNYSIGRLFCPRAIYPYWREIWLSKVK